MEIVEGKDRPVQLGIGRFQEYGKTGSLLLRLFESIFSFGKVILLDSGFCALAAIVALRKFGVHSSALIKKWRYWPKHIDGVACKSYFESKPIGHQDSLPGTLDNVHFRIMCFKKPYYGMLLMCTYGSLIKINGSRANRRIEGEKRYTFQHCKNIENHYQNRGAIDDHNNKRHDGNTHCGISLENAWKTHCWEIRLFFCHSCYFC